MHIAPRFLSSTLPWFGMLLFFCPGTAPSEKTPPVILDPGLTIVQWVGDLPRAITFYRDVLGCTLERSLPEVGFAELRSPVAQVQIGLARRPAPKEAPGQTAGGGTVLTFAVTDADAAALRLRAHGFDEVEVTEMPGLVRLVAFSDPDGNPLQLAQSLGPPAAGELEPVAFLAGTWRSVDGDRVEEEIWSQPRAGSMLGVNRTVQSDQTRFFEFLRIMKEPDGLTYHASPRGRPAVEFKMVSHGPGNVLFSNETHDFPQHIRYQLLADGRLRATVSGTRNGREVQLEHVWRRNG